MPEQQRNAWLKMAACTATLERVERDMIVDALKASRGNMAEAARVLEVSRARDGPARAQTRHRSQALQGRLNRCFSARLLFPALYRCPSCGHASRCLLHTSFDGHLSVNVVCRRVASATRPIGISTLRVQAADGR
jgi:hypothetical protein